MAIIPSIIKRFNAKRISQIDHFKKYPVETQQKILFRNIGTAASTEWGKNYDYSSIKSVSEYQSRVPVRTFEEYFPYIERLLKGVENLTWPGSIKWFAKSSGTTSAKSKFIPITNESLEECHYKAGKDILAIYTFNNPGTKIFSGKALHWEEAIRLTSSQINRFMAISRQF